jgi:raffinose/stachyose/melibiose transport system substrate-binding protein
LRVATTGINPEPIQVFIGAFKDENPDTEVSLTNADTDKFQTTLRTQLASGTAPDVFFVWPGNGNAMAMEQVGPAGYIADLSDQSWADDIPREYESVTQLNGKTMILPTTTTLIGAITNKQIMEDLDLEAPGTWDELLAGCEEIKQAGKIPIALGNATPWVTQLIDYALVPSTVYADNPDFDEEMKAGNATFVDSGWRDAMEKYLELNDRGYFNENPLGTSYEQQLQLVANGEAAMAVHVSTSLGQVENYGEAGQYVVLPFPGNEDPDKLWIPAAAGGSYGLNADAKNPEGGKEFLGIMAEPENMNKSASLQGALPGIPNDQFEIDPALESMIPFLEEGKTVPFMDQLWPNAEVQQAHFAAVQQLFTGEITIDEALRRMDEAYQKGS